jgi:hypothetical protein
MLLHCFANVRCVHACAVQVVLEEVKGRGGYSGYVHMVQLNEVILSFGWAMHRSFLIALAPTGRSRRPRFRSTFVKGKVYRATFTLKRTQVQRQHLAVTMAALRPTVFKVGRAHLNDAATVDRVWQQQLLFPTMTFRAGVNALTGVLRARSLCSLARSLARSRR